MSEKSVIVRVPRELLERLAGLKPDYNCAMMDADEEALRALLAAPAEDVRAVGEEPVPFGYWRVPNEAPLQGMFLLWDENMSEGVIKAWESRFNFTKLYRHPPRPFVFPERMPVPHGGLGALSRKYADGWNSCLDAVEELNK